MERVTVCLLRPDRALCLPVAEELVQEPDASNAVKHGVVCHEVERVAVHVDAQREPLSPHLC